MPATRESSVAFLENDPPYGKGVLAPLDFPAGHPVGGIRQTGRGVVQL